jgi:hypothetical protein
MDLELLAHELEPDFEDLYFEAAGVRVYAPPVPVDLELLSAELYPDECDETDAYRVVGDVAGLIPMLVFHWEEEGARPFQTELDLLALGERVYLTISPDEAIDQRWEALAAFEDYSPAVLAPLLLDLLRDNGTRLGADLLSSLPTRVSSKFIRPITFLIGFRDYLDWDEERNPGAWEAAAQYLPQELAHHDRLAQAAAAVAAGGTGDVRDEFLAAYVVATFDGDIPL